MKRMGDKKNIILIDFHILRYWILKDTLEKKTGKSWEVVECRSNHNHGNVLQNIIRHIKYILFSFNLFLHRREYNHIVAWQQFLGLFLVFYCCVFRVKKTMTITIMNFVYVPRKGLTGRIYRKIIRLIINNKYLDQLIVSSSSDPQYYGELLKVPIDKFAVVRLGVNDDSSHHKVDCYDDSKYFVAAGRSNRDYVFLMSVFKGTPYKLKIISDEILNASNENIEILNQCHGKDYFDILSKAYCVVLPLKDPWVASGHFVTIQAMMFSKPVIASPNNAIYDYIDGGCNGLILEKSIDEWRLVLKKLVEDQVLYDSLSTNARKSYECNYTLGKMSLNVSEIIAQINT